ncbi:MAG TPA: NUDIX domain-containing protein [Gemmatimonadaceae bacterium]|nr:NUDIX domain-containing protein [Gemmatimonadaceae bacterium]
MRDRLSPPVARPATRRVTLSVDVILLTSHARRLTLLLTRSPDPRAKERWETPWDTVRVGETLESAAERIARSALGAPPAMIEQVGAVGGKRHPGDAEVSVAFLGLVAAGSLAPTGGDTAWFPVDELPPVPPRHRSLIESALQLLRSRIDQSPIAFRLLPPTFTLSQLQEIYELLLGRRLHKASFRRALHAAWLVEPTDEWRTEGRGRPAQLFRFAPRKRRGGRRGVRFGIAE